MNSDNNVPNNSESTSSSEENSTVHYEVGDVDIEKLKRLYPEFFDQDKSPAKGIEIYVWQMSAGSYSFGLMYGTNRNKTDEEIWDLQNKSLTLEETKARVGISLTELSPSRVKELSRELIFEYYMELIDKDMCTLDQLFPFITIFTLDRLLFEVPMVYRLL